jgi:hypothetical protein
VALLPELGGRVFSGLPDAIFGTIARGAGEEMMATRIANDAGLTGAQHSQRVQGLLSDARDILAGNPPTDPLRLEDAQKVLVHGQSFANDMTYRNPLGKVSKGLESAARLGNTPVLGNTPQNMQLRALERTPLGAVMNTHNRPGTTRTKFDRVYDTVVGSSILAGLYMGYVSQGYVTGSGPDDPEKRKELEAMGWRPYSTLLPGPDGQKYYAPNRNIANYGTILNALGDYHDAQVYQKPGASQRAIGEDLVRRFGQNLSDSPYASGLTELVKLMEGEGLAPYAASLAGRITPYGASQRDIATSKDPYERQVEGGSHVGFWDEVGQRWQQATGIGRQDLPVKTDVRGQSVENQQQGWRAFLPKGVPYQSDPIIQELLGKNVDLSKPRDAFPVTVAGADAPDGGIGTKEVRLNAAQRQQWQQYRWQAIEETLLPLMQDPEFRKQRVVRSLTTAAGQRADGMMRQDLASQWDDLVKQAPVKQAS